MFNRISSGSEALYTYMDELEIAEESCSYISTLYEKISFAHKPRDE